MPKRTFKVGTDTYDIEENEVKSFLTDMPNAVEFKSFINDNDTFDIALNDVGDFLKDMPNAKPTFKEEKKNEIGQTFGGGSGKFPSQGTGQGVLKPSQSKSTSTSTSTPTTTTPKQKAPFSNEFPIKTANPNFYDKTVERNRQLNYNQGLDRAQVKGEALLGQIEQGVTALNEFDAKIEPLKESDPNAYNQALEERNSIYQSVVGLRDNLMIEINKKDIYEKGLSATQLKRELNEDTYGNRWQAGVNEAYSMALNTLPMIDRTIDYMSGKIMGFSDEETELLHQYVSQTNFKGLEDKAREVAARTEELNANFVKGSAWDKINEYNYTDIIKDPSN